MKSPIAIKSISSISPLGHTSDDIDKNYKSLKHSIGSSFIGDKNVFIAKLQQRSEDELSRLINDNKKYKALDRSVLLAIYSSRQAIEQAHWNNRDSFGVNIGSSRGATQSFETFHSQFLSENETSVLSSPTTTLGNISSWVAHDLNTSGPDISHSITCSTSLHSILNGIAWLRSGMCKKFLVGGSEAPLTAFTISQMKALKIYAENDDTYPSRPLDLKKKGNTMVLGEGAAVAALDIQPSESSLALITGIGYATEILKHNASLSTDAVCLQRSMAMALSDTSANEIDVIITHSPGTLLGDKAELGAIHSIFKDRVPAITNNKWKIGHTFGASGIMSVEMAIYMLKNQTYFPIPYLEGRTPERIKNIMINSVGFGGNAVSLIVSSP